MTIIYCVDYNTVQYFSSSRWCAQMCCSKTTASRKNIKLFYYLGELSSYFSFKYRFDLINKVYSALFISIGQLQWIDPHSIYSTKDRSESVDRLHTYNII